MSTPFDRSGGLPAHGILGPVPQDLRTTGLTYEPFYGLREKPFSLTSDERFFYQSRSHAPAFYDLVNAIKRRESLTVLTGDIGTGKTTLCRAVLQSLDRKTFSAFVTDPFASREELLKVLLTDFGVSSVEDLTSGRLRNASRTELSYLLYEFLGTLPPLQAFAVVFIDEAQNLSVPLLEEIRILSDSDGQLQVVLVGQLEFREKLKLPQMRQLDQRVSVHCRLEPLDVAGVAGYISHRLHRAGGSADRVSFSGDAVETIYDLSGGVPRVINKLCDRALQLGQTRKASTIDADIVESANPHAVPPPPEPVIAPVTIETALSDVSPRFEPAAAVPQPPIPALHPSPIPPSQSPIPPPRTPPIAPPEVPPIPSSQARPLAPLAPPVTAGPAADSGEPRVELIDAHLAEIEHKAAAARNGAVAPRIPEDPRAWRERWAPNDAVSESVQERGSRYRIRVGTSLHATPRDDAASHTGSRQFVAVLLTMIALLFVGLAGPSVARASVRLVRYVNAQFSPALPPPVPSRPLTRVAFPRAPQVPAGPY